MTDSSATGQVDRCTDVGPPGFVVTKRSCQTRSVMNGTIGAIRRVSISRVSCKVHRAL